MTSTFPHARRRGYDVDEVEDFLVRARLAYQSADGEPALTAEEIRRTGFTLRKGGYAPEHVDAALERLEDAFARRERESAVTAAGDRAWFDDAKDRAQEILDRVVRPRRHRFRRTTVLAVGYSVADVDAFADRIAAFLQTGAPLTVGELRTVAFRSQRGGYDEAQVDVLLDATIDVLVAVG